MFDKALKFSLEKIKKNTVEFADGFLSDESSGYIYKKNTECTSWTEGFWPGMLWLAYEITNDGVFKNTAKGLDKILQKRIFSRQAIDTHDLGFLYTLSCVAEYKICGDKDARRAAIEAADRLVLRFHEKGQFIQAWGRLDEKENYRLIIDCLMNLPLLFWASEETGDMKYADIAKRHFYTAIDCVVREDYTTHHTFYFDSETGEKVKGVTRQGYSDNSCWARGQAWGIYGIALAYKYLRDDKLLELYNHITDCFIERLPEDYVPYWDMVFTSGGEPRDTSAAAIAAGGIMGMNKYFENKKYMEFALKMMQSMEDNYLTDESSNGILTDGMYSKPDGSEPECNVWGDYFFLEALIRLIKPDWKMYW